ncbi:MAG TPA: fibronectin type III domain-containing protein [Paludibacter sp.]|nr:fibronectin type III domain-containing protein [Paludibacter sp.]
MKKLFTLFICLCAIVALQAQTATAPSNIGEVNAGTSSNPYKIATLENLYWFSQNPSEWGKYYVQTADLDLSAAVPAITTWDGGSGWTTIGGASGDFTGTYDGQGHTITGLYINRPSTDYIGLFGSINGATIKNLGVTDVTITGNQFVGGLVGRAWTTPSIASNCFSSGSVTGATTVGGLIGDGYTSNVDKCYSTGLVSGTTNVGGLIGISIGTTSNCFWDTDTSHQSTSGGGTGKTTVEMKTASTFTSAGWNTTDWQLVDGAYPILIWTPTMQASAISFPDVASTWMTVSWTKGNGSRRAVFIKNGTGAITNPVDQTTYAASPDCSSTQSQLGSSGYYCIYNGTGNSVTINGLLPNTQYTVQMFEYNGVDGFQKYLTTTATDNPKNQTTLMPAITSATYDASTGVLVLACTTISIGDGISPAKMTLTGEGGTTYTLTTADVTANNPTSVSIMLNDADKAAINQIFNKNGTSSTGATTYNLAAADDWDANITIGDIADLTGNGITVSNVAAPTITSAAYDAAIGALVVTGIGYLKLNGDANDIDVPKLTITGEGGATYTLTAPGVEITSGTSFTVVLNETDKAAINQIFNKNGTSSTGGTTYNLAAAEDWAAGADAGVVVADLTGNGVTVSNLASPAVTTQAVTSIGSTTATGNGNITDLGVPNATQYGVVWSTSTNPTVSLLTKTTEGTASATGAFTSGVTGLAAGTTYYVKAYATNSVGTVYGDEVNFTTITVPDAPAIGTATAGDTQASVSFTAPAFNGGSTITGYTVTSSPGNFTGTGTTSPIIVTGLTNSTAYTFTITATNIVGTSTASAASNSVTPNASQTITFANPGSQTFGTSPTLSATATSGLSVTFSTTTSDVCSITPEGVLTFKKAGSCTILADQAGNAAYIAAPTVSQTFTVNAVISGTPTIGTATAGDGQASVSFTAPVSTGGEDVTYTVTSSPGNLTGTGATSPITVTGLSNGTTYTFTVTATNVAGTSTASAASNSVTPIATQTITFANPGSQNFGTSPMLSATATSGLLVTFSTTTSDVCSITPEGVLTFKKAGSCTILADQAGNAAYTAAPTVSQSFTVNAVIPGAPTIGTATAGDGQASVSFTAPASTGGADVTYTVTSSPGNLTGTGATSPITVTGLSNGTTYTFTVTVTNVAGTSTASAVSNSVTAYSAPTVTTDVAGDITSSGVTLKGTVAANGASTAVTFEYGTTNAYGTSVTATQSPVTEIAGIAVSKAITGLTANTTYHYRVVGVNAGGTTNGLDQTFKTDFGTGLDNAEATVLSLYPNPATEGFYINVGEKTTLISISDLNGSLVLTQQATGKSYVSISLLQKGVYVVKTNGLVAKLVKK